MVNQRSSELICTLLLIASLLALPSFAAENRWSSNGLPGADVTALVMDGSNRSLLYMGTYGGGVFKTVDAGGSWTAVNAGINDYLISCVAMNPISPATLYAGTYAGKIFSTIDGGASWAELPSFTDARIHTIVAAESGTVFAATLRSVFRSTDGGANWREAGNGLAPHILALSAAPSSSPKLFAGTESGLFTSSNRGDNWSRVDVPGVKRIGGLAVSADARTIYVNSESFHTSTDGGRFWNRVAGDGLRNAYAMAIDPSSTSTAWATTFEWSTRTHGVFRTTDAGRTWQRLAFTDRAVTSLLLNGDTVYAGTSAGLLKTTNDATSWNAANSGLNVSPVSDVVIGAVNPALMYAATPGGVFKTTDHGTEWARSGDLPDAAALAIDPNNSSVVFASSLSSAMKTTDGGATWSQIRPDPAKLAGVRALAIDPSNPSAVYAVLVSGGLSKSIDGGSTFSFINSGLPFGYYGFDMTALAIDPSAPSRLFASSEGVSKSTDAGASWGPVSIGLPRYYHDVNALAVDPSHSDIVYAATWHGLYQSSDGGHLWKQLQIALPMPPTTDVVVDPWDSANVYVSTYEAGVYKSKDRGQSWTAFNEALPVGTVHSLAIDSTGRFLAAATAGGVFTFSSGDGLTLPAELHAERLSSDPGRLRRLLEQVRVLSRSSPPDSQDSVSAKVGFVFAAAANTAGALGTHFRSDVTLMNGNAAPQDVMAVWLAAGSDGTDAPSFRLTLAPSAITVTDFVGKLGFSGLGSLLFIGIDANTSLDTGATLLGFSRIWTAGPDGRGAVSQSFPAVSVASLGGNSEAAAIGLRMDSAFRTNVGIMNLDTASQTFRVTVTGERESSTLSVAVEPFSLRQVPLPDGDYGALTALFEVAPGEFPWTAYASSVDNLTGDGWVSQAAAVQLPPGLGLSGEWRGTTSHTNDDQDDQVPCPKDQVVSGTIVQSGSVVTADLTGPCYRAIRFEGSLAGASLKGTVSIIFPQETFTGSVTGAASNDSFSLVGTLRSGLGHTILGFTVGLTR